MELSQEERDFLTTRAKLASCRIAGMLDLSNGEAHDYLAAVEANLETASPKDFYMGCRMIHSVAFALAHRESR